MRKTVNLRGQWLSQGAPTGKAAKRGSSCKAKCGSAGRTAGREEKYRVSRCGKSYKAAGRCGSGCEAERGESYKAAARGGSGCEAGHGDSYKATKIGDTYKTTKRRDAYKAAERGKPCAARRTAENKTSARRRLADTVVLVLCCIAIAAGVCGTAAVLLITGTNSGYRSVSAEPDGARAALSDAERLLLCRFICAECEGEPFVCKVSAAAVVMNRIESEYYPGCCANVIFDAGAFSCVSDGTISDKRSEGEMRSAMRAVELAEGGEDPTDGACSLGHVGEGFRGALPEKITFEAGNMVFGNP